jgi:hypothetical protein
VSVEVGQHGIKTQLLRITRRQAEQPFVPFLPDVINKGLGDFPASMPVTRPVTDLQASEQ